jgi:hypothetical protein
LRRDLTQSRKEIKTALCARASLREFYSKTALQIYHALNRVFVLDLVPNTGRLAPLRYNGKTNVSRP